MRVLFLRRQKFGGIATFTQTLAGALHAEGVEAVVDDVEDWIPNETGRAVDRRVSRQVSDAKRGFDLVHAFGFRAAWACSEALGSSGWVYTAHDMPKTVHPELIRRLNDSRFGGCSSEAVLNILSSAGAKGLEMVHPGLPVNWRQLDRTEARAMLGADEDAFLLVVAGTFCKEHSIETAIYVTDALPYFARLVVCGQGELEASLREISKERVTFRTGPFSQQAALAGADLVVVPSTVAGFSMTAIEAMLQGTPVMFRRTGGLSDIAEDERTGFYFETDEELLDRLTHLCFKREYLREVGRAARQRILESFDIARTARQYAEAYRRALAPKGA